ncbi:MAG TPA: phosphoribosyltransferase [Rhodanobacteraceae bacterium]|nr:phosphoribosyltransferase [Rhodanobacteraceae bacterium]
MASRFLDRRDAGRQLAERLRKYAGRPDVVVLALPRGGVPVGCEVARALDAPLDVLVVRKLGVPQQPELAMGAIASGGARFLLNDVLWDARVSIMELRAVEARERAELTRRERLYRGARPPLRVQGRVVIVVDDGIATGATMQAAALALRSLQPARIVVAVPVASADAAQRLDAVVNELVCVKRGVRFFAIDELYEDFEQVDDQAVRELLGQSRQLPA